MHPEMVSMACRQRMDPQDLEALMGRVLSYIHAAIPDPPVSVDGDLCILFDADGGGVDRLSRLPEDLLRNIILRLPVKDAACTTVLSRRWRPIWYSAPLILVDSHLLPAGEDKIPKHVERDDSTAVAAALSTSSPRTRVARWLQHLTVKGVQELFLINRPWPLDLRRDMPATIFSMATLTRLYLGFWRFPDTAGLPRGAAFPYLRELGLCCVIIDDRDIDYILARSPVLDILCFEGHMFTSLKLHLVSQSLRCLQLHACKVESITVVDAPRLDRIILWNNTESKARIKIGSNAPALRMFGYFELGKDVLQIGRTTIKAGIPLNPSSMVPSLEILALPVRFGVRNDAKMLPSFLRCFPNLKTVHILSKKTTESTGRLNLKFWQESGAIECIQSHVTMLAFHDFRGERSELAFLKFFIESAQKLKMLVLQFAHGYVSSETEAKSHVNALFAGKRGAASCTVMVCQNGLKEGGDYWDFQRGFDYSNPFALFRCQGHCLFTV
ncbi:hypothetical protein PR202_ga30358 [Eleusine coracana subsp. coracana]|uniref:F-box domain-containing protein n=1 Tax=Eleusine coracana subsp. coracana TaxID=191504 RepID=A0AAV5DNL1_ELECO|nr:hypothetical protein PR202_ga30358 [Eleusine coracana subsp. coracana]